LNLGLLVPNQQA